MRRTCQTGAGPAGRTASVLGRCTCCSSSQSPAPAAQPSDSLHGAASRSQRFSSPAGQRGTNVLIGFFPTDFRGGGSLPGATVSRAAVLTRVTLKRCLAVRKPEAAESCS